MKKTDKEVMQWAIKHKDVKLLVKLKWGFDLTPGQVDIVRRIAFMENKRLSISAMTRYGKTQCVALGIALLIDFGVEAKIAFIGPKEEQAGILRQYMAELITTDDDLRDKAQLYASEGTKLVREASRKRMTFNTGAEYRVFSAEGDANRLMGFGADIVVKDEACLIGRKANAKIMRMLGDSPETAIFIELMNPWDRDNVAFENSLKPEFHKIQIGWEQAVKEGRTTALFVEEQRQTLTPLEFTVLYDSDFPELGEDSIFNLTKVKQAIESDINLKGEFEELHELMKKKTTMSEHAYIQLKNKYKEYTKVIGADIADKGTDHTVIYWGFKKGNIYQMTGWYSEKESENTVVAGRIMSIIKDFIGHETKAKVNIDCIGVGVGVVSMLKEQVREQRFKNVHIVAAHYGKSAVQKDRYINKKSENYFRSREIFNENQIKMIEVPNLVNELAAMKWDMTSAGKIRIIDPEDKSPDYADALVYFMWKDSQSLGFAFA